MSSSISEMTTVKPCKTIRGHTHHVQGVVHLPDERHIITGSGDGSLRLWELQSGTQVGKDWRDEEDKTLVTAIALSPNGTAVASGGFDGKVRLWDVETGKVIGKWTAHSDTVASVCWSTDGKRVLSGSGDAERNSGTARVWDIKSSKTILEIKTGSDNGSWVAIYSPDSLKIATVGKTVATIWDAKTGKLLSRVPTPADLSSMVWMSDGKKLVGGSKNSIMIFDTSTLQKITTLEGHRSWVHVIALSRNERLLVSASYDYTAHLWNLDTNLPVGPALEHERTVLCAAISADGKLLVTGCDDNNVYVWDLHAILNKAGLEDLLSIPDVPAGKSLMNKKATRQPGQLKDSRGIPLGFFDDARDRDHSSAARSTHGHSSRPPSSSLRSPRALLNRLTSLFRQSSSHTGEATELQRRPRQSIFSRRGPRIVEVATVQDRKPLAVAPRPENQKQPRRNQTHGQGSSSQNQAAAAATSTTAAPGATVTGAPTVWSRFLTLLARLVLFLCCAYPPCSNGH